MQWSLLQLLSLSSTNLLLSFVFQSIYSKQNELFVYFMPLIYIIKDDFDPTSLKKGSSSTTLKLELASVTNNSDNAKSVLQSVF